MTWIRLAAKAAAGETQSPHDGGLVGGERMGGGGGVGAWGGDAWRVRPRLGRYEARATAGWWGERGGEDTVG
ncbi:MAG: hypothetical protein OEZ02_09110 [Anaerolineae bacterium]|nr:hypothetical protein [Anaerolineae bacterium]